MSTLAYYYKNSIPPIMSSKIVVIRVRVGAQKYYRGNSVGHARVILWGKLNLIVNYLIMHIPHITMTIAHACLSVKESAVICVTTTGGVYIRYEVICIYRYIN